MGRFSFVSLLCDVIWYSIYSNHCPFSFALTSLARSFVNVLVFLNLSSNSRSLRRAKSSFFFRASSSAADLIGAFQSGSHAHKSISTMCIQKMIYLQVEVALASIIDLLSTAGAAGTALLATRTFFLVLGSKSPRAGPIHVSLDFHHCW